MCVHYKCCLCFANLFHSFIHSLPVIHKLELRTLRSLKSHGGVDRALLSFDIHADMRPAFHWNIKQLFVYVVASYKTDSKETNQIVVWDKILEAVDHSSTNSNMVIQEENVFVKYALVDQGDELRGKDVTLQLMWDHMPITGLLYMGEQNVDTATTFTLPAEYQ
jgi:signal peptidase complex subunit 3